MVDGKAGVTIIADIAVRNDIHKLRWVKRVVVFEKDERLETVSLPGADEAGLLIDSESDSRVPPCREMAG